MNPSSTSQRVSGVRLAGAGLSIDIDEADGRDERQGLHGQRCLVQLSQPVSGSTLGVAACASGRQRRRCATSLTVSDRRKVVKVCGLRCFARFLRCFVPLAHRDLSIGTLLDPQVFQVTSLHTAHQWLRTPDLGYDVNDTHRMGHGTVDSRHPL